jgi:hypothetical protein
MKGKRSFSTLVGVIYSWETAHLIQSGMEGGFWCPHLRVTFMQNSSVSPATDGRGDWDQMRDIQRSTPQGAEGMWRTESSRSPRHALGGVKGRWHYSSLATLCVSCFPSHTCKPLLLFWTVRVQSLEVRNCDSTLAPRSLPIRQGWFSVLSPKTWRQKNYKRTLCEKCPALSLDQENASVVLLFLPRCTTFGKDWVLLRNLPPSKFILFEFKAPWGYTSFSDMP